MLVFFHNRDVKICTILRSLTGVSKKCSVNGFNVGLAQPAIFIVVKEFLNNIVQRICLRLLRFLFAATEYNSFVNLTVVCNT